MEAALLIDLTSGVRVVASELLGFAGALGAFLRASGCGSIDRLCLDQANSAIAVVFSSPEDLRPALAAESLTFAGQSLPMRAVLSWSTIQEAHALALTAESPPWVVLRGDSGTSFQRRQEFLGVFAPSRRNKTELAWIAVQHTSNHNHSDLHGSADVDGLVRAWSEIKANIDDRRSRQLPHELLALARRFSVLSGKWMVFCHRDEVDGVWSSIAQATLDGRLMSAKVSPTSDGDDDPDAKHVICVYTDDFTNREEVMRVRATLKGLGLRQKLPYKPDIYTYCEIYRGNPWGLSPVMFLQ